MDLESQATIDEALNRAKANLDASVADALNKLQTVGAGLVDRLMLQVSNVFHGAINGIAATEDKTAADIRGIINSLDGWKATITVELGRSK